MTKVDNWFVASNWWFPSLAGLIFSQWRPIIPNPIRSVDPNFQSASSCSVHAQYWPFCFGPKLLKMKNCCLLQGKEDQIVDARGAFKSGTGEQQNGQGKCIGFQWRLWSLAIAIYRSCLLNMSYRLCVQKSECSAESVAACWSHGKS